MKRRLFFIDAEISFTEKKILDLGAVRDDGAVFHSPQKEAFCRFIAGADAICGHNIIHHDLKFLSDQVHDFANRCVIDTLYLSPLLFPKKPYHRLLKDDKLQVDECNNPVNDCIKAQALFEDEVAAFKALSPALQSVYYNLLCHEPEFKGFFDFIGFRQPLGEVGSLIKNACRGLICENADVTAVAKRYPVELAYAVALTLADDRYSVTPYWLQKNYPKIESVVRFMQNTPCAQMCPYCKSHFDIHQGLRRYFGFDRFREFEGEALQEQAVQAAVDGASMLVIFPTGGGKSLTFQLPALMAGQNAHGLTVVISPLQSLMKDQVDNLFQKGIIEAATINGLLDIVERADAVNRTHDGSVSLLYIAPEMLRSKTLERILMARNVVRFVIDEAHCFSAWGQDFRVDYLYIADFIRKLQEKKHQKHPIPISCFTATAKPKVITDICDYFKSKLNVDMQLFATSSTRKNLRYNVQYVETEEEKYNLLRNLISAHRCPTIVYVSRTRRSLQLAEKLTSDGYTARPFNGKMDTWEKIKNQNDFIDDKVQVIVATSAFGMGVDKANIGLVVHYDISDSLENYVQEAGRAGRDLHSQAQCYILFNENDLDKHFILLNQTKLSMGEIQQVWKAIKDLTHHRPSVCCSALEIARQAGWDDSLAEMETRVRTAIAALETAGYVQRGDNVPHVYATSIRVKNMDEAHQRLFNSPLFDEKGKQKAVRIIKSLISSRSIAKATDDEAESRVDYLADILGLTKDEVIDAVNAMRQAGILSDDQDLSAFIIDSDTERKSRQTFDRFAHLETVLLSMIPDGRTELNVKELNENALANGIGTSTVKNIKTILYFLKLKNYISLERSNRADYLVVTPCSDPDKMQEKALKRLDLCSFIIHFLYTKAEKTLATSDEKPVAFSLLGLQKAYKTQLNLAYDVKNTSMADVQEALLYLSKIGAMRLEGGFMVLYNAMEIKRIADKKARYKNDDYSLLNAFYKQRIRQIHIVGEYAKLMVKDYDKAMEFVRDYFHMDFEKFIAKYFEGERRVEIDKNISPEKYQQIFGELSPVQLSIINDKVSKYIVVAAGPGSGKTKVLVHKLASLLLMEDVKHEQLLMLTFSRAAATEFKKRLIALIGNAAHFVEIKTFHSYCFDLMGKIGTLQDSEGIVKQAAGMIRSGAVEMGKIAKAVLVIDEAQDMNADEFSLVKALMERNEDMRVIAVGDDDQNIYEWRGANSDHFGSLVADYGATCYEMVDNYRSASRIVQWANAFAGNIQKRMKSTPIHAVSEGGEVACFDYVSPNLEIPLVAHIRKTYQQGKACVLTQTNDEALRVQGLLLREGIRSKLIQSTDYFSFYNLVEVRYFLKQIEMGTSTPFISDALWGRAKEKTLMEYKNSRCLDNLQNFMADFERINMKKYKSDLWEFVKESHYEDFYDDEAEIVFVSTIHKAKGREFDTVYMLLNNVGPLSDEVCRKLYVGMTRAKRRLFIHANSNLFSNITGACVASHDDGIYAAPSEIAVQLSLRDVVLDDFKGKKEQVLKLRSGDTLLLADDELQAVSGECQFHVLRFSKKFLENKKQIEDQGYEAFRAEVAFVVAWKGQDDTEETAVVLPNVYFRQSGCRE